MNIKNRATIGLCGLLGALWMAGCSPEAGEGGTAKITGKVWVQDYNAQGELRSEYLGSDEKVYIIYGDSHTYVDDEGRTSYDGSYAFNYLYPGTYTIFAYEDCDTCASGQAPVMQEVVIQKRDTKVEAPTIVIRK